MKTTYQISPLFPDTLRTVDTRQRTWTDVGPGYLAVSAMDAFGAARHSALTEHLGTVIRRDAFQVKSGYAKLLELERFPTSMPAVDDVREDWHKDGKPVTSQTGGSRRHLVAGPLTSDFAFQFQSEMCARWAEMQIRHRPYCHVWDWTPKREAPDDWSEGSRQVGPDGEGWTIDDDQHTCTAPSFTAAAFGNPVGLFAMANITQYWGMGWQPASAAEAERGRGWMLADRARAALLRLGEEHDGNSNAWADAFMGGRTALDLLVEIAEQCVNSADLFPYSGVYRSYKIPRLEHWPEGLKSIEMRSDGSEVTTEQQPKSLGEYPWQWGIALWGADYAARVLRHRRARADLASRLDEVTTWHAEQLAARLVTMDPDGDGTGYTSVPGVCSFYTWSGVDIWSLLRAYYDEFPELKAELFAHQVVYADVAEDDRWCLVKKPALGHESQQAALTAVGLACAGKTGYAAPILEDAKRRWNDWSDILAPGINAIEETSP